MSLFLVFVCSIDMMYVVVFKLRFLNGLFISYMGLLCNSVCVILSCFCLLFDSCLLFGFNYLLGLDKCGKFIVVNVLFNFDCLKDCFRYKLCFSVVVIINGCCFRYS